MHREIRSSKCQNLESFVVYEKLFRIKLYLTRAGRINLQLGNYKIDHSVYPFCFKDLKLAFELLIT